MKVPLSLLSALFGAALAAQKSIALNDNQPDLSALAANYRGLTDSFLPKVLENLDEHERCARKKNEQPTCTRDNIVLRKE